MTRKFWQRVSWPIVFAGLTAPFALNCGGKLPGLPGVPNVAGNCPDMTKVEAIESFDFEKEFKLNADAAAKVKAGAGAAAEIKELQAKIDGDLKTACTNLAHDLGGTGDYANAEDACKAAVKVMGEVKAKFGANAQLKLEFNEPRCSVDVNAYADCAGSCDATLKGGKAEVKCEGGKLQGQCSGQCSGECDASAAAACSGECSGSCDAEVSGACSGKCDGKCDGKVMDAKANGQCSGKCEGKCSGNIHGSCKGKCGGSCKMSAAASCQGTCSGSCSVQMQAPKCSGKVEPPKMTAECKAKCDAKLNAKAECTPPHVSLRVVGAADAQAAAKYQAAIEKNLPAILNIAIGMKAHLDSLQEEFGTVQAGVSASLEAAGDPQTKLRLTACVMEPVKGALDAVAKVQASVSVSVNVQASASASGSAKAG
jgi:hypothetical protein